MVTQTTPSSQAPPCRGVRHLRGSQPYDALPAHPRLLIVSNHLSSGVSNLFCDSAEHLATRLESEPDDVARVLAQEARELARRFATWQERRPTDEEREALIRRLFDVNRRAMDYLAEG